MKPSDIFINGMMPLTGTFGRVEAEAAAAVMIAVLAATDDEWRAVHPSEPWSHPELIKALTWSDNPFVRPQVGELISRGFAATTDDGVEFTPAGLEVLRASRWNQVNPISELRWSIAAESIKGALK